ncbi:hypothetical protein PTKIN_Ptkin10aG0048000 [Pterospermum kingtungense]
MVRITDIPDWCYMETYGSNGKSIFTEAPSAEHLTDFYNKSPMSHISKYSWELKERGVETKLSCFPKTFMELRGHNQTSEAFLI